MGLQSTTCVSYSKLNWTTVIQSCLFWERGLICRMWDYQMMETVSKMGCQLRCVWNFVTLGLVHIRWITKMPQMLFPISVTLIITALFKLFSSGLLALGAFSLSLGVQPLIAQPTSMFTPTRWTECLTCITGTVIFLIKWLFKLCLFTVQPPNPNEKPWWKCW